MKRLISLFTLLFFAVPSALAAGGSDSSRSFEIFGGAGMNRVVPSFVESGSKSSFTGWAAELEGGVDFPLGNSFGIAPSVIVGKGDLLNTLVNPAYVEKGTVDYKGAKVALFYRTLALGSGLRDISYKITSVPATPTGSERVISGVSPFYFGTFSFDFRDRLRASAEIQYQPGTFGATKVNELTVGLKFFILLQP